MVTVGAFEVLRRKEVSAGVEDFHAVFVQGRGLFADLNEVRAKFFVRRSFAGAVVQRRGVRLGLRMLWDDARGQGKCDRRGDGADENAIHRETSCLLNIRIQTLSGCVKTNERTITNTRADPTAHRAQ